MEPNQIENQQAENLTITQSSNKKIATIVSCVFIFLLLIVVGIFYYTFNKNIKTTNTQQPISNAGVVKSEKYLEKTDPIYQLLTSRVINDIQEATQKMNIKSPQNKELTAKINTFTKEKSSDFKKKFTLIMHQVREYECQNRQVGPGNGHNLH